MIEGFKWGFQLDFKGGHRNLEETKNLKSAYEHEEVINKKIKEEIEAGRYLGPFTRPPLTNLTISPLGVMRKKDKNKFRMITHLSHPKGSSINDGIAHEDATVQYASVGDAIKLVQKAGRHAYMAKTDIENAYRIIPLHPSQFQLTGLKCKDGYIIDRALPMGCRSSAKIFERFSTAIEWIARNKLGIELIIHILDDYFIVNDTKSKCSDQLECFLNFCKLAGIPISRAKTTKPNQIMEFAGIELDSNKFCARLSEEKIQKCLKKIKELLHKQKSNVQEILEVTGLLNFAVSVVYPGRAFLRRMYNSVMGKNTKYSVVKVTDELKEDLRLWKIFLKDFNGVNFFMQNWWVSDQHLHLYTDSAKTIGYGGIFGREWFHGIWPNKYIKRLDITTLELYPIVIALEIWGEELRNLNINIHTDNQALVSIINSQTVKQNIVCLHLLRRMVLSCLRYNVLFKAWHVKSVDNTLCDLLSRRQVQKFKSMAPEMKPLPTKIPPSLSPEKLLMI